MVRAGGPLAPAEGPSLVPTVLVDGAQHTTYVAERHLEPDAEGRPVRHPLLHALCGAWREGRYLPRDAVQ